MAEFKVLSQHLPGEAEEDNENAQSVQSVCIRDLKRGLHEYEELLTVSRR
jgi:hypothetical protein